VNPKSKHRLISTVEQGQAGVYQVASQLLLRGFRVCFPAADGHGVDLVLESGMRIQVKTSHLGTYDRTPYGAYWFNFGKTKFATATGALRKEKRNYSEQCDFVILWGIEDSKFWIVPSKELDNANGVVMGRAEQYKDFNPEVMRSLLAAGHTQEAVAKLLDTSGATISRRNSGKFLSPKRTLAIRVRLCEDRWDLIRELEQSRKPQGQLISMPAVESVAS
jgi:hypothetical protein